MAQKNPIIRAARFVDTPKIVDLCNAALTESRYAAFASVDRDNAKRAITQSIGMQGPPDQLPRSRVTVADNGTSLVGVFVGILAPLYDGLDVALATDLIWYVQRGTAGATGLRMMRDFHDWVGHYPGHVVLRHGVTDAINAPEAAGRVLKRAGFRQSGLIYEKESLK